MISLLGSITDTLRNIGSFIANIPSLLMGLLESILNAAFMVIYMLLMALGEVLTVVESLFKRLAGIDVDYGATSGSGNFNDLISQFIFTNEFLQLLLAIIILSIILLFIFTFISIIKSEFTLDVKQSAKGPIIARALKALAMFFIIPIVSYLGILGVNVLTQTINNLMNQNSVSMANQVLNLAMSQANKARTDGRFASYIAGASNMGTDLCPWENGATNYVNNNGGVWMAGMTANDPNFQETLASNIDDSFMNNETTQAGSGGNNASFKILSIMDSVVAGVGTDNMIVHPNGGERVYTPFNVKMVSYYYNFYQMNYILGFITMIAMLLIMLQICWQLTIRIFEILILLLLAAPMNAIAPLDNGNASKQWSREFIKRVVMVIGPVFAINCYFIFVPMMMQVNWLSAASGSTASIGSSVMGAAAIKTLESNSAAFAMNIGNGIWDSFLGVFFAIVGLKVVESAGALLSMLMGADDMIKGAMGNVKKAQQATMQMGMGVAVAGAAKIGKRGAEKEQMGMRAEDEAGEEYDKMSDADKLKAGDRDAFVKSRSREMLASTGARGRLHFNKDERAAAKNDRAKVAEMKHAMRDGNDKDNPESKYYESANKIDSLGKQGSLYKGWTQGKGVFGAAIAQTSFGKNILQPMGANLNEVRDTRKKGEKENRDAAKQAKMKIRYERTGGLTDNDMKTAKELKKKEQVKNDKGTLKDEQTAAQKRVDAQLGTQDQKDANDYYTKGAKKWAEQARPDLVGKSDRELFAAYDNESRGIYAKSLASSKGLNIDNLHADQGIVEDMKQGQAELDKTGTVKNPAAKKAIDDKEAAAKAVSEKDAIEKKQAAEEVKQMNEATAKTKVEGKVALAEVEPLAEAIANAISAKDIENARQLAAQTGLAVATAIKGGNKFTTPQQTKVQEQREALQKLQAGGTVTGVDADKLDEAIKALNTALRMITEKLA